MENPSTWGQGKWSDAIALFPWKDFHISETSSFTLHFALIGNDDDEDDIYIMMSVCVSVCHEKSSLPPGSLL